MAHTRAERDAMLAIEHMANHMKRIADVLERLESFFIATSVEEVQKRVEDMHNGRA